MVVQKGPKDNDSAFESFILKHDLDDPNDQCESGFRWVNFLVK